VLYDLVKFSVNVTFCADVHFVHMNEVTQLKNVMGNSHVNVELATVSLAVLPHELHV
jgi:hypothetical protein